VDRRCGRAGEGQLRRPELSAGIRVKRPQSLVLRRNR
jgi:hypothetical protein